MPCPPGANALRNAAAIEDPAERKRLLSIELPSALCSPEAEVRACALHLLRQSRDLDLTDFREALLCGDARDADDIRKEAERRRAEERAELLARQAENPDAVTDEEVHGLEGPVDVPKGPGPGEHLLERWEYAHASRAQRIDVYGRAIAEGDALWRHALRIDRDIALREACLGGLSELRPQVERWLKQHPSEDWQECRLLLGWLDSGTIGSDDVVRAISELASMNPGELDQRLVSDAGFFCAYRHLNELATSGDAGEALRRLKTSQRTVILERLRRTHPEVAEEQLLNFAFYQDRNAFSAPMMQGCKITKEPSSPCGWAGW